MKKLIITIIVSLTAGFAWANPAQIQAEIESTAEFNQKLELAKSGDAQAQADVAKCYLTASGVKSDSKLAVEWAKKSAKQGNLDGLVYYFQGQELKEMPLSKENLELIEKLKIFAEKGNSEAQFTLGLIYKFGAHNEKKEPDFKSSLKWFEKAYAQNNKDNVIFAAFEIANLLLKDIEDFRKVDENIKKRIFNLMKFAADGGSTGGLENAQNGIYFANFHVSNQYRFGIGCKQDLLAAVKYAYQGALLGEPGCLKLLKQMVNDLEDYLKSQK